MSVPLGAVHTMLDWLRASGGTVHPSTTIRADKVTGVSVFAADEIGPDERLITCPSHLAITPELATRAILEVTGVGEGDMTMRTKGSWNERMRICTYICLHWIAEAKHPGVPSARPPALAHFEYINALPPASSLITPLHFNYIERLLLGGTNLMPAQRVRGREWGVEWGYIKRALKTDDLTWSACHPLVDLPLPWLTGVEDREMYLTAATHLSSRAFPSKLLSSPVPLPGGGILTEGDESHPILLPGIDLFNHARAQPILWLAESTGISLVTTQPQPAGKQIYNNYGAKSNEELLLAYGFVLDPNPDDIVVLRLGTSMDVDKRTRGKRLDVGKMFYLRRDGEVDKELLEVMRATLRQDEPDVDEEDEHALHERETRELQLELDVVGTLGQMMEDMQVKLQAGVDREIGEPGQIREEVRRMCEVYRRGQIEILETAMDKLESRVERLEGMMDQGMGSCACCS